MRTCGYVQNDSDDEKKYVTNILLFSGGTPIRSLEGIPSNCIDTDTNGVLEIYADEDKADKIFSWHGDYLLEYEVKTKGVPKKKKPKNDGA